MPIDFPEVTPGIHPPTAALAQILKFNQVVNPLTGQPYSEEMLFGIGGGLDIGYILYQFNHLPHPILILGFRNNWNNTQVFLEDLTHRLRLKMNFQAFDDQKSAQSELQKILKEGKQAIVWVDKAHLPHRHLPESLKGFFNHQVAVFARDGRLWRLYIDDLSSRLFEIREKTFTEARANLSQCNYLMMTFEGTQRLAVQDLQNAAILGIKDCATQLTRPLKTVGISNLNIWANQLMDQTHRHSWVQIFDDPTGLFPVLCTLYESIKLNGTGGFALRKLYADFLHEAASLFGNPELNAVAGQYLQLSNHWSNLAENALPSRLPIFDRVKNILNKQYEAYRTFDLQIYQQAIVELEALAKEVNREFPLNKDEIKQLFEKCSNQLQLISELETGAAKHLYDVSRH